MSDPLRFTADIAVIVKVGLLDAIPVLCKEVDLSRLYSATWRSRQFFAVLETSSNFSFLATYQKNQRFHKNFDLCEFL